MERIIKFRRAHFRFSDNKFDSFSYWGPIKGGFQSPSSKSHCFYNEGTDQQFTGLKDIKGKEIYEGDIVQDIIVFMKSQIVFTDYANFGMKPINSTIKDLEYEIIDPAWAETSLEIIGNIYYETPELLT